MRGASHGSCDGASGGVPTHPSAGRADGERTHTARALAEWATDALGPLSSEN